MIGHGITLYLTRQIHRSFYSQYIALKLQELINVFISTLPFISSISSNIAQPYMCTVFSPGGG